MWAGELSRLRGQVQVGVAPAVKGLGLECKGASYPDQGSSIAMVHRADSGDFTQSLQAGAHARAIWQVTAGR